MREIKEFTIREAIIGADGRDLEGDFFKSVKYLNHTGEVMKIRERSGFVSNLNPCQSGNTAGVPCLVARIEMHFNHRSANDNYNRIVAIPESKRNAVDSQFLKAMTPAVRQYRYITFTTFVVVEKADLLKNGGVNYLPVTDGTLYIGAGLGEVENEYPPGSEEESLKRLDARHKQSVDAEYYDSDGLMYSVRIVDNTSEVLPTYYANVLNNTVPIKAIRDSVMKNGVYLTHREPDLNKNDHVLTMKFFEIEDKLNCFIPIYDSRAEAAKNFSHPDREYMKNLAREQEAKADKAASEAAKAAREAEKALREVEKAQRDAELMQEKINAERARQEYDREKFIREEEAQKRKNTHEEETQKRKNTFDLIKYGPVILNALVALITLVVSIVTKTPPRPIKV